MIGNNPWDFYKQSGNYTSIALHYGATELAIKDFTDVCTGDNCLLNL